MWIQRFRAADPAPVGKDAQLGARGVKSAQVNLQAVTAWLPGRSENPEG